jgi:hypothetical protein
VVAAYRHQPRVGIQQLRGAGLNLLDRGMDVIRGTGDVSSVGDLEPGERFNVQAGVVGPQQPAGLPHGRGGKPGAGSV